VLPPEETKVEALPPAWVTEELIEKTVRVWSRIHGRTISGVEAMEILAGVGRLVEILRQQMIATVEDSG